MGNVLLRGGKPTLPNRSPGTKGNLPLVGNKWWFLDNCRLMVGFSDSSSLKIALSRNPGESGPGFASHIPEGQFCSL